MIVTKEWMENRFEIFNRQYFQGQLPKPGFTLSRARTQLGQCRCRYKKRGLWQRNKLESCVIALSTYYDMEEREACNVLLHEMIHYYIAHNQLKDTSAHGRLFRQIAQSLNARWGWQVSVKTSVEGWALAQPQKNTTETFLILAVETSGGACYLSVVMPSYAHKLEAEIQKSREVIHHRWYTSRDDCFKGFPKVRSLRGRKMSKEDLSRTLSACQPFNLQVG